MPGEYQFNISSDFKIILNDGGSSGNARSGGTSSIVKAEVANSSVFERTGFQSVAIKYFDIRFVIGDDNASDNFQYEIALMSSLPKDAPNLIKFLGFSLSERAIIMPFYEMSLYQLIRKNRFRFSPSKINKTASDVAKGMKVLHDTVRMLHLDLKPGNILVDQPEGASLPTFIICDFGYANFIGEDIPVVSGVEMPTHAGLTIAYAAPEILNVNFTKRFNKESDKAIDVYAYAMTLYEVLMQKTPWYGLNSAQIKENVISGKRPVIEPKDRFEDVLPVVQMIERCWHQDPLQRPQFKDICGEFDK